MSGQRNSYGKRPHSNGDHNDNGGRKRRNSGEDREPRAPGPEDCVYRYLCKGKQIGSIIGKGGEIVKQLRADTNAKIRIGESVPGCDERVITIFSTSEETNLYEDTNMCPAQDALFRIHEKLTSEDEMDDGSDESGLVVTARLLVPGDQIGCLIGKGGQTIQGIRSETGAQIRILKDHLPVCAMSGDELLQVTGEQAVVKKAILQLTSRLHEFPSRSNHLLTSSAPTIFARQYGGPALVGPGPPLISSYGGGYRSERDRSPYYLDRRYESSAKEFSLRLLCPTAIVGGVIGKAGSVIRQIRQDSGANIVVDSSSTEDDCIITISANEHLEDPISKCIDAAVRLQPKCSERTDKESGELYMTRLLVPTSRIGCLIGKAGSIISEMRRATRANIRILSKEHLPKVASEDDEMVQICGDLDVSKEALIVVATRLKANCFGREGTIPGMLTAAPYPPLFSRDVPEYSSRDRGRDRDRYSRPRSRGYSPYSDRYDIDDVRRSDRYSSHAGSLGGGSFGGGYTGRSGSAGSVFTELRAYRSFSHNFPPNIHKLTSPGYPIQTHLMKSAVVIKNPKD